MPQPTEVRPLTAAEHEAFTAARLNAVLATPYFARALWRVTALAAPGLDTAAVDRHWRLYLDPDRLAAWGPTVAGAVLGHEVSHLVRDHAGRADPLRGSAFNPTAWNVACDAAINDDLLDAGLPLPDTVVTPQRLGLQPGGIEEFYYEAITPTCPPDTEPNLGCGSGAGDPPASWELDPADTAAPGFTPTQQRAVRHQIALDITRADPGTVPAGLRRWGTDQLRPPQINWRAHLRSTLRRSIAQAAGCQDYTYTRPGRRRLPQVITPALRRPVITVAVVIDTSTSMTSPALDAALAEITGLVKASRCRALTVITCDVEATVTRGVITSSALALTGGGGTDMRVGIAAATATKPRPDVVVVLTDGYTPWPERPTPVRLVIGLIASTAATPEWAHTVHIRSGD